MIGVSVIFFERGYPTTKRYTYLSDIEVEVGQAVVVPTGKWYSVGKVVAVTKEPVLDPKIKYKHIIDILNLKV